MCTLILGFTLLYIGPQEVKKPVQVMKHRGYSGLTNANSERYAKRLGDYWGSVINKAKGKKGQIVVIVQQTNKFLEPIERIRKEGNGRGIRWKEGE